MPNFENVKEHYDVIVVGAGISGLACAKKLQEAGKRVCVLESKDRIGGRLHSVQHDQVVLDVGASWIHGLEQNPIWDIAQNNGIKTYVFNYLESDYFFENAQAFTVEQKQQFLNAVQDVEKQLVQYPNQSVADALSIILNNLKTDTSAFNTNNLPIMLRAYFKKFANDPFATEPNQLSAQYPELDGYFAGDEVIFPQGYAQVLQGIAKDLEIQLFTQVQQVILQDDVVQVRTSKGHTYIAKQVVLSVSLGILKKGQIEFIPQLPAAHLDSITKLGFGSFNKVFFELSESLNLQQHSDVNSFFYYVNEQWFNILDLSKIYHKPMYLMLFGGEQSEFIDTADDSEVWNFIYQDLKRCLSELPSEAPKMMVTRWGADEHSFGSFSFPSIGYSEQWVKTLNEPVAKRIFFTGEHCSLEYAGTVHGAYLSGRKVADQLESR